MRDETRRNLRVGLLVLAALAALAVGVLTIGQRQQLFIHHTRYYSTFRDVLGLQPGAPVDLEGVTVGFVDRIDLPTQIEERRISVWFTVDARYTARIRKDTVASIKTVGLLGDKYLKLTGGTPGSPRVLEGGMVRGLDPPELEHLVAGGADLMENLLAISSSLKVILKRVEAGEGVLGQITMGPTEGKPIGTTLTASAASLQRILSRIEQGHGVVGRMVADDKLAQRLFDDLTAATGAARDVTTGLAKDMTEHDSAYAVLMRNPEAAGQLRESLAAIHQASQALAAASEELASGQGTLPRLLRDRKFAGDFLGDLEGLTKNLRSVADKLNNGDGTAGAFINDPQIYKDMENVVRGVKSSKIVSWFIRNRRKKGEKIAAQEAAQAAASHSQ